jgi:hypothetical protein
MTPRCPRCGSPDIAIERRIDGDCHCRDCMFIWPNEKPASPQATRTEIHEGVPGTIRLPDGYEPAESAPRGVPLYGRIYSQDEYDRVRAERDELEIQNESLGNQMIHEAHTADQLRAENEKLKAELDVMCEQHRSDEIEYDRLRALLERVLSGTVHVSELREALEKGKADE